MTDSVPARALVVPAYGGPEVLDVRQVDVAAPGAGQLQVRVAAAGVNFIDVYRRQGVYPTDTPFVLGQECAGTVLAVGPGVGDFEVGDVVATATEEHGTHAEVALLDATQAVPVPAGVPADVAAAAILQGMTAHYLASSTYPVRSGDEVLVHAAAGGTGRLLVQFAKARGAHVIGTVGSAAKEQVARLAGTDVVIRYDEVDDLAGAVRDASGGGVHVAYDGVGKATFDASLGALRRRGMLVLFGGASGQVPPFNLQRLNAAGSVYVTRPTLAHYVADREELLWRAAQLFDAITGGALEISIGARYPLERAADAYRDLEARRSTGKLLLVP